MIKLNWLASKFQGLPVATLTLRLRTHMLLCGDWELSSGPHAHTARVCPLSHLPSPHWGSQDLSFLSSGNAIPSTRPVSDKKSSFPWARRTKMMFQQCRQCEVAAHRKSDPTWQSLLESGDKQQYLLHLPDTPLPPWRGH